LKPLLVKTKVPYIVNPETKRTVKNNARNINIINKQIKIYNDNQNKNKDIKNMLVDVDVLNGLSTFLLLRLKTQNITDYSQLYDFLLYNFNTGKKGYRLKNVFIHFINDRNNVIFRSIPQDYIDNNDLNQFETYMNGLFNGASIGSDAIDADEFTLNLDYIDFYYTQSGEAEGVSDKIIFKIEDVNNIKGNKKNECINNSLKFVGFEPKIKITTVEFLMKYLQEKNIKIAIISNIVKMKKILGEKKVFNDDFKMNVGYLLKDCDYEINYLYRDPNIRDFDGELINGESLFTFVYDSKNKHIDVIKNNKIIIKNNIYTKRTNEIFINESFMIENTQLEELITINTPIEVYKEKESKTKNELYYIFFDYETIINWKKQSCMQEYSLSWFVLSHQEMAQQLYLIKEEEQIDLVFNNNECYNLVGFDCSNIFIEWFNKFQINKICKFVSYNGANFDNYLLLNAFLMYKENNDNIKISDLMYNGNQLLNFKINGCHTFYDLHKHLMGSLKGNCESFKIPKKYSKLDLKFTHQDIQILYDTNNEEFINEMKKSEELTEYNNNDVFSLAYLFCKYYNEMSSIEGFDFLIGEDFTKTGTIGSMIMKRAKNHWDEKKIKLPLLNFQQYQDVLKYKIAGRVEIFSDKPIKINEEVVSLDVCSLYPYIMFINPAYYPAGEVEEVEEYQGKDLLGFYYCDIDQRALKLHNLPNIYAEKTETENKWDSQEILKDYLITNITIELLKKYENIGVKCVVKKGFVFTEKIRGFDLFNFLAPLMEIKNKQDNLKNKPEYNPALRECVKLLMNSISGKVIEGLHAENIKMISTQEELTAIQAKQIKGKIFNVNVINSVGKNLFMSYNIDEKTLIKKQKPVYLGAFIYEYARTYMYENLLAPIGLNRCLYMDTDALKFRKSDIEKWQKLNGNQIVPHWRELETIDERYKTHILFNENSKVFGSLENELKTNNLFYALQKKFWLVANIENGNTTYIKTRYKGINPKSLLINDDAEIITTKYKLGQELLTLEEKVSLNKEPKEIFHWINKNENLTIGSDYDKKEGIKGKQIELFEKLYNDKKVNVLVQNFKRVVKNGLRNVGIEETERFNILNNTIQAVYMIKTITIKN